MSSAPPQQDIGDTNESLTDTSLPIDFSNSSNIKETKKTSSVEKEVISANNGKLSFFKSNEVMPNLTTGETEQTALQTRRNGYRAVVNC